MTLHALGRDEVQTPESGNYWVAHNATVLGRVILKENASIWFNAVLRGDNEPITVGESSNIQDGTVCHTDMGIPLTIGRGVTVGHMAMLHGCTIGDNSLIGIGAVILNNARIGKNCLIGAKALVTENAIIPDNSMVLGMPGKVVRELKPEEIERLKMSAENYVQNSKRFRRDLA